MRLSEFIGANREMILAAWEARVRARVPQADALERPQLRDHVPVILEMAAARMDRAQARGADAAEAAVTDHAESRIAAHFQPDQLITEFALLRACVVELWLQQPTVVGLAAAAEVIRFAEALDELLRQSLAQFAEQMDRSRNVFLAVLGHDLRAPLGAIALTAEAIGRSTDSQQQKQAARIQRAAERMARLITDLVDFARSRLGEGMPLVRAPTDLAEVCRKAIDEAQAAHPKRVVVLRVNGNLTGEWDGERLAQLTSNLVGNALQHGRDDSPVTVSAQEQAQDVTLSVHNFGPPIPPDRLAAIFEPMEKACGPEAGGLRTSIGLGLFIVREIANAHGGEVSVTSSAEDGTTFTVRLPRGADDGIAQ